jgi:PKD repeat protein
MRAKFSSRTFKNAMILLVLLTAAIFAGSCRSDEVEIPPLTGPSGARLFLQVQANPDHLVIHEPGRPRETSEISIQLKNHLGQGVPGENLKLRILNRTFNEINIGRLSDFNVRTDGSGFARVIYTAPDTSEIFDATSIFIRAILTNAAYPSEVIDTHEIELQRSSVDPGECAGDLFPQGNVTVSPSSPVVNEPVCFNATEAFPTAEEFFWDFGNGDTATSVRGQSVCTEFGDDGTFTVSLIARSLDRDCGELAFPVVVEQGEPATCTLTATPSTVDIGEDVNFIAIVDDPEDGDVRRFEWNFGDGETQRTNRGTTSHSYDQPGTFTVILIITDDQGNTSTCTTTVTVQGEQPICSFTTNPDPPNIVTGSTITFTSTSTPGSADIVSFQWDFGDGGTGNGQTVSHTFTASCTAPCSEQFQTNLTVTDDDGLTATCGTTVIVDNP